MLTGKLIEFWLYTAVVAGSSIFFMPRLIWNQNISYNINSKKCILKKKWKKKLSLFADFSFMSYVCNEKRKLQKDFKFSDSCLLSDGLCQINL